MKMRIADRGLRISKWLVMLVALFSTLSLATWAQNDGSEQNLTGRAGTFAIVGAAIVNLNGSTQDEMAIVPTAGLVINFPRIATFGGFGGGGGGGGQQIDFNE